MSDPQPEPGSLAGRRVIVTRAAEQAGPLVEWLKAAGAEVIELPLIAVVGPEDPGPLAAACAHIDRYDWVVVTSPNGAAALRAALAERVDGPPAHTSAVSDGEPGGAPRSGVVPVRVAAVGRATEAALGRSADLVPTRARAEGLIEEFPCGPGRVLLVQGDLAPPTLADALTTRGWTVTQVVGYRTLSVAPPADRLDALAGADVVTFASGSAVRAFVQHVGLHRLPPYVVTIGPSTTQVAESSGVAVTACAPSPTLADLGLAVTAVVRRAASGQVHDDAPRPSPSARGGDATTH